MKKIVLFTPKQLSNIGGGERVLSLISNELSRKYDVTIITPYNDDSYYKLTPSVTVKSLGYSRSDISIIRKFQFFSILLSMRAIVNKLEFDYFIAFASLGVILTSFLSIKNDNRFMCWIHTSYYQPVPYLNKKYFLYILKYFSNVIILNKLDSQLFAPYANKVTVIPNPLSFNAVIKSDLREKRIVSVGRLEKNKGFDCLINICTCVFELHNDWRLDIYGQDDGERENLERLIKEKGMQNNIEIHSAVSDITSIYISSSIFAFTSLFESFGLVLIEANECGLPCVCFNSPSGIKDLVIDGYNGYLIEQFDNRTFEERILQLIESYDLRLFMSQNALNNANNFRIDHIMSKWYNLLK